MEAVPGQGELSTPVSRGSAADLHGREPSGAAFEWCWLEVDSPALVLGSTQRPDAVDGDACAAAGVDVVQRRSGGGAVLIVPGEILWLDVIVPRNDPRWDDDLARSMWWLGDVWARALTSLGATDVAVHRGPLVRTPWSSLVCFDGLGPGEVTVGGVKAVGISQRRTRAWARLQTSVHVRWRAAEMVTLLAQPRPDVSDLADVWTLPDSVDAQVMRAAVERAIRSR